MNKTDIINELIKKTNLSEENCSKIINNIIGDSSVIGKGNKEKIVGKISKELKISKAEAEKIYEIIAGILVKGVKDKIKNLFKSKKSDK
ncbi:MAG: hypothetical protein IJL74_01470 [Bacilli bacterium]|nr:hypothetical protein [Bacilli bacterium]